MNAVATCYLEITAARYLKNYQIEFEFNDETKTVVDLKLFKNFTVRDGDIDWSDYELCFPIADIYEGHL